MIDIIQEVVTLQNEPSMLKKQEIILKNKDNEHFKKHLYYALNPMLTYKVSEQTLNRKIRNLPLITLTFTNIYEVCEYLSKRKAIDDVTLYQVICFLECHEDYLRTFYTKLLSKTLKLGITARTVNKIIPNLIPEWNVQQAYTIEKYPLHSETWFALTEKLNGVRATYYNGKLIGRSGIPFDGLDHITNHLEWNNNKMVFDGELTLKDKGRLSDNEAFRVATGIINSEDEDKSRICYTIFDALPTSEFETGESTKGYKNRRSLYLNSLRDYLANEEHICVLPILYSGEDQNMISKFLDKMVAEDKEGLMLNLDTPYKCHRHNGILKIKRFYTMDLPIIRCEEGSGRLCGTLGAVVLDYKGNEVSVGSGFTDDQRKWFWKHKEDIVGCLCEVKYKEISADKRTRAESLQFPIFISIRTDKDQLNYE
ncbi:MAG: hypothetical protein Q4C12_00110 [Clostridia bacterium]|nr:hypothetical protein [Clostridia bacterium]